MSKICSTLSGLIGGSVVCIVGILLLRWGVYILDVASQVVRGTPVPSYKPLYTLGPSGAYLMIIGVALCLIVLVLWTMVGTGYGILINKQQWNKKKVFRAWLLWGMSNPVLFASLSILIVFYENGNLSILENTSYRPYLIILFVWWAISGLSGGFLSALYITRRCRKMEW